MAITPDCSDNNLFWLSSSDDEAELFNMRGVRVGTKAIVLKPSVNKPSFYIYTSKEEWEYKA